MLISGKCKKDVTLIKALPESTTSTIKNVNEVIKVIKSLKNECSVGYTIFWYLSWTSSRIYLLSNIICYKKMNWLRIIQRLLRSSMNLPNYKSQTRPIDFRPLSILLILLKVSKRRVNVNVIIITLSFYNMRMTLW